MTIRVLIVDDSTFVRDVLRDVLSRYPDISIVGEARDGKHACELLPHLEPDVITMDILMPMLGGFESIEYIMNIMPTPVLVVADAVSDEKLRNDALEAGAVGSFRKPSGGFDNTSSDAFAAAIRVAAGSKPARRQKKRRTDSIVSEDLSRIHALGIVSSTGGPQTLAGLLKDLPPSLPIAICIVQHTSSGFTGALADWLAATIKLPVRLAEDGALIKAGEVVIAADDRHLEVRATGRIRLSNEPPVGSLRPAGDILLKSLAKSFGRRSGGLVCTGMGHDGTSGLVAIRDAGGTCLVQAVETAIADSMPRSAAKAVKESREVDLPALAEALRGLHS